MGFWCFGEHNFCPKLGRFQKFPNFHYKNAYPQAETLNTVRQFVTLKMRICFQNGKIDDVFPESQVNFTRFLVKEAVLPHKSQTRRPLLHYLNGNWQFILKKRR